MSDPRGGPAGRLSERARGDPDRRQGAAGRDARPHGPEAARGHELRAPGRDPAARGRGEVRAREHPRGGVRERADPERAWARERAGAARRKRGHSRRSTCSCPLRDPQPQEREPLDRGVARRAGAGDGPRARRGPSLRGCDLGRVRLSLRGSRCRASACSSIARRLVGRRLREIGFGDTTGMANPVQVERFFDGIELDAELTAHFHNTRGQGLANALAALRRRRALLRVLVRRARRLPGAPGATGNMATEDLVSMLHEMGYDDGRRPGRLTPVVTGPADSGLSTRASTRNPREVAV